MPSASPPPTSTGSVPGTVSPRRNWRLWAGIAGLLLAGYVAWNQPSWNAQAETGAAYGARMACSCRYVQGRPLESCERDAEPGMELVSLSDDAEEKAVSASVPLLASRTARYRAGTGCVLDAD